MATLAKTSYPGDWDFHTGEDWKVHRDRTEKLFADIPIDKKISLPWADGAAFYYIKSEKPLVLQHIPYGDAWHVPYTQIRGLRLADVKAMIKREKSLRKMFGSVQY